MTTYLEWGIFDPKGKFSILGHGHLQPARLPANTAVYRCAGRLKAGTGRANENVEAVEVLTIDDVGSRIDLDAMTMLAPAPTDVLETSPGNFQWQYVISGGGMGVADYVALRSAMKSNAVWGKSHAAAPSNLIRVAQGVNGKPGPNAQWKVVRVGGSGLAWDGGELRIKFGGYLSPTHSRAFSSRALRAPSDAALVALLARLPNTGALPYCDTYDAWVEFGLALWGASGGTGLGLWEDWCSTQIQQQDETAKWVSFGSTSIGWDTLCMYEDRWGVGPRAPLAAALFDDNPPAVDSGDNGDDAGTTVMVEALQRDVANAIVSLYGDKLRWNVSTSLWHRFDGVWRESPHKLGYRLAKKWADAAAPGLGKTARAAVSKSAFYEGVEKILQSEPALAVVKGDFDKDIWLLGTPEGTVELKTGAIVPAKAGDMISMSTLVAPAAEEDCPRWLKFVSWACTDPATGKVHVGMLKTLKQWAGYCLCGDVSEEKVMFFHGDGANGKGTFIETLQAVMGDYFYMATKDLFMETKFGAHTEEIAALAGKRMVAADEVPTNAKWNESMLKSVSGGGPMTSRHLFGRVFTFPVGFKLTIIGNERPAFQGAINEALKRRLRLVAFRNTARPADLTLKRVLKAEAPGVLRWMLNGLADMLAGPGGGLFIADSVLASTDEYFNESDLFGQWMTERLENTPGKNAPAGAIFEDWENWRNSQGAQGLINSHKKFKAEMLRRGKIWAQGRLGNVYNDLSIRVF